MGAGTLVLVSVIMLGIVALLIGLLLVFAGNKFHVEVDPKEIAIRKVLPGNNCGACGYPGCDGVAAAIASGEAPANACPVGGASCAAAIGEIMGVETEAKEKMVAFVKCSGTCDKAKFNCNYVGINSCLAATALPGKGSKTCQQGCLGFGSCVEACHFDALHVIDGVAVVDRTKCVGCGQCAHVCPQHLIELVPDRSVYAVACANIEKGKTVRSQCDAGCIGCSLCVRQCEDGAVSVSNNIAHIDYEKCVSCGKCAAKCPAKVIRVRNEEALAQQESA